ncbi:MAG: carbamoyltransferase family protein [Planctomycetota bacterium]|jgi:carbamoyltransferase
MIILGVTHPISWNPAAALLVDGELVAMAEEERFNRLKFSPRVPPLQATEYCLAEGGVTLKDVDLFAVGWESARGQKRKKRIPWDFLASRLPFDRRGANVRYVRHHLAHAVSAFFPSGFERANLLSLDAYGGAESGLLAMGIGADVREVATVPTKGSWGHMYGKITERLGFRFHADEGKLMGLAAYGTPCMESVDFVDWESEIPRIDGKRFRAFLERAPRRLPREPFGPEHKDLASTAQAVLERAVVRMAESLHRRNGCRSLCLGGGVALNCSLNGALEAQDFVDALFINPGAHDASTALGAALWVHREATGERPAFNLRHPFFGPAFDGGSVEALLGEAGIRTWKRIEDPATEAADWLARGKVVGWFQGRMEFGPRALGNRSILADPGEAGMTDRVNDIKGRERWRPLAPSILAGEAPDFVEGNGRLGSPFMLLALRARAVAREKVPAVVHVDGSMRLQTVDGEAQPRFLRLLEAFKARKGYGVLLNTSFNLGGQPIVCDPKDALGTFFASGLDGLFIEDFLVWKE